jgi:branched-chain amino acid transport system permease protein
MEHSATWTKLTLAVLLLAAVALPLLLSDYRTFQVTQAMIYAVALMGLNILIGHNGQISLGHGAFYALGAYTAAILISRWGVSPYLTIPAGGLIAFGLGYLFGIPALKLHGLYLALATLALALALPQLLRFDLLEPWTGGVQGIFIDKPEVPLDLPLSQDQWLYYLALVILIVLFRAAQNMVKGGIGRALAAIRDHHIAAETMGIDTARLKTMAFAVSAFYAGIAGALSALVVNFVAPDSYDIFLSIALLVGVVVGGLTSVWGSLFGGLFIVFVPNVAQGVSDAAPWAVYGIILIALMFAMPHGVAGLMRRILPREERQ